VYDLAGQLGHDDFSQGWITAAITYAGTGVNVG
jgi:hypothetical protein